MRSASAIRSIFEDIKDESGGRVADYIPCLARVPADSFAVAVNTIDGQHLALGDADTGFTLQSSCKPILYAAALDEHGVDKVHTHVGREPSGLSFNELTLNKAGLPHNPMINAGAIMTSSLSRRDLSTADRLEHLIGLFSALCGRASPRFNTAVWHSERETADRNFALAHHMRERGAFPHGIEIQPTLDCFFSACSIEVTARNMATIGATFANGGVCPLTGERVFSAQTVKNTLSMMYSCGMYDFHNYDSLVDSSKKDPRRARSDTLTDHTYRAIYAASIGDISELKRLVARGHDLNVADYDGRTPLHLACAEGHVDTVRYHLCQKVNPEPEDRWVNTPLADASRHGQEAVEALFADAA